MEMMPAKPAVRRRRAVVLVVATALLVACATLWLVGHLLLLPDRMMYEAAAPVGTPEAQVRARLGPPAREYAAASAPTHYYEPGWTYRERPITDKVLIYRSGDAICYVWTDTGGLVEEVFVGGS